MKNVCVIGHPIKHSRSPLIHGFWMQQLGIKGSYTTKDVSPTELHNFLKNLSTSQFVGCNVTLPHKEASCLAVDHPDDRVKRVGALNTVFLIDGKTHATSTDGQGFVENIRWRQPTFNFEGARVVVLGAGGSSRAIIDELLREKVAHITVVNRTWAKAEGLVKHFGKRVTARETKDLPDVFNDCQLLINTTSAGIADSKELNLPLQHLPKHAIVADINYVPLITPLLTNASNLGYAIVPGLGMLLHQAVAGFKLWFGKTPVVDQELYDLIARDIDPDYRP